MREEVVVRGRDKEKGMHKVGVCLDSMVDRVGVWRGQRLLTGVYLCWNTARLL